MSYEVIIEREKIIEQKNRRVGENGYLVERGEI